MLYDNCVIQAPDGMSLSRCGLKKAHWYLERSLADVVAGSDPLTIRLRFEPSGRQGADDPQMQEGKPNICVVCGTPDDLTRHHIIPYSFIRHMELKYKIDIIRDIFPVCAPCHMQYEKISWMKRHEMARKLGIPIYGIRNEEMTKVRRATGASATLLKYGHKIPEDKKLALHKIIREFLGQEIITEEDLIKLRGYEIKKRLDYVPFSKYVAERVSNYDEFAREWRQHFVDSMKPKHMPESWKIDRKTESVWIPSRFRSHI